MTETIAFRNVLTNTTVREPITKMVSIETFSDEYIISIPHAGLLIPEELLGLYDPDHDPLIEIDVHSDKPYEASEGVRIASLLAPFVLDMNRSKSVPHGVPHHLTNDPFTYYTIKDRPYLEHPLPAAWKQMLEELYDTYHAQLSDAIASMKRTRGYALVFDAHSMTSRGLGRAHDVGMDRPDFAIGTLFGTSADPRILDEFERALEQRAAPHHLSVARDTPYAGGFITRLHHSPSEGVHVIQLEVSMGTYLNEGWTDTPHPYELRTEDLARTRAIITEAIRSTAHAAPTILKQRE